MGLCDGHDPPDVHGSGLPAGGLTLGGREREKERWVESEMGEVVLSAVFRWAANTLLFLSLAVLLLL